jgi:hypothetical protein
VQIDQWITVTQTRIVTLSSRRRVDDLRTAPRASQTFRTGTGFGARWKTEKRAALIVTAMATITRLKPRVGAILSH